MTRARSPGSGERADAGFTLIELLLAISLVSVILLALAGLLTSTFETFRSADERIACHAYLRDALQDLIEGGFRAPGLRDAAALLEARADRLTFIAPQLENVSPDGNGVHTLGRRFYPGSGRPSFEYEEDGRLVASPARVSFDYANNNVVVPASLLTQDAVVVRYLADPNAAPSSVFEVLRDASSKLLVRRHGSLDDELSGRPGVDDATLSLRYYDRSGQELALVGGALDASGCAAVASIEVDMEVQRGDTRAGDVRRVDLFNGGERVLVRAAGLTLPDIQPSEASAGIRLGNFDGADPGEHIGLVADTWSADIVFGADGSGTAELEIQGSGQAPMQIPFRTAEGLSLSNPDRRIDQAGGADPDPGSALHSFLAADHVYFQDDDNDGRFGPGDELYLDTGGDGSYDAGADPILVGTQISGGGTHYSATDARVPLRYYDRSGGGVFAVSDPLILDENIDGRWGGQFLSDAGFASPFALRVETFQIDGATLFLP